MHVNGLERGRREFEQKAAKSAKVGADGFKNHEWTQTGAGFGRGIIRLDSRFAFFWTCEGARPAARISEIQSQTVIGQKSVLRQFLLSSSITEIMAEMGEEGLLGAESFSQSQAFCHAHVSGMRSPARSPKN